MIQKSPNRWSCLPTSTAMVLEVPVKVLLGRIGHDGSEVWWPQYQEPYARRGFHLEEVMYAAYGLGWAMMPFYAVPTISSHPDQPGRPLYSDEQAMVRMDVLMKRFDGVMLVRVDQEMRRPGQANHALAWVQGRVVCPNNGEWPSQYDLLCFVAVERFAR